MFNEYYNFEPTEMFHSFVVEGTTQTFHMTVNVKIYTESTTVEVKLVYGFNSRLPKIQ